MKWRVLLALAAAALPCALLGARVVPTASATGPQPTGPVLVELYTSEGCSSCPPAEAVLGRLAVRSDVVVLAHHVDYWDGLGWRAPFSSAAASARQQAHGGSFTPEVVVDGATSLVGSREGAVVEAVGAAGKRPHVPLGLAARRSGDAWDVTVQVPKGNDVLLAIVQDRARVTVPRGENAGRSLDHVGVVRELVKTTGTTRVTVPAAISAADGTTFSVVAFATAAEGRVLGTERLVLR